MTVLIEDWNVIKLPDEGNRLHGKVYGHPKFTNGTEVITSEIQFYDPKNGFVRTVYTEYKLGDYTIGEFIL